jgi:hypothetical protein
MDSLRREADKKLLKMTELLNNVYVIALKESGAKQVAEENAKNLEEVRKLHMDDVDKITSDIDYIKSNILDIVEDYKFKENKKKRLNAAIKTWSVRGGLLAVIITIFVEGSQVIEHFKHFFSFLGRH